MDTSNFSVPVSQSCQLHLLPWAVWRRWTVVVGWALHVKTVSDLNSWGNHTIILGAIPVLLIRILQFHDQPAPAHPHQLQKGNNTPSFLLSSVSPARNLTKWSTGNLQSHGDWHRHDSRCGQVWQPCRPGLVELWTHRRIVWCETGQSCGVMNGRAFFFLCFQAERCRRHTVSFRNEVNNVSSMQRPPGVFCSNKRIVEHLFFFTKSFCWWFIHPWSLERFSELSKRLLKGWRLHPKCFSEFN